jgi:hypothetical protein
MPHHEHKAFFLGQAYKLFCLGFIKHQGLFHKNMLACQKCFLGKGVMGFRRGGNDHAVNIAPGEHGI